MILALEMVFVLCLFFFSIIEKEEPIFIFFLVFSLIIVLESGLILSALISSARTTSSRPFRIYNI